MWAEPGLPNKEGPATAPPRPDDETPGVRAGHEPGSGPGPGPRPGPARPAPSSAHGSGEARHVPQRPSRTGPGPGWGPARPAGRPGKPRVGSGVPRLRVAAEGLKKRRPRTACDSTELVSSMVRNFSATSVQEIKQRYNPSLEAATNKQPKMEAGFQTAHEGPRGRGPPARGPRRGLHLRGGSLRAAASSQSAPSL